MRFRKFAASVCAIAMTLTAMPVGNAMPVLTQAATQNYQDASTDFVLSIGQVCVTESELAASNYQVPVLIKLPHNPGINLLEFGVQSSLNFEVISKQRDLKEITSLPTASPEIREASLTYYLSSSTVMIDGGYLGWLVSAGNDICNDEDFAVLLMQLPSDAMTGDIYPVTFLYKGLSSAPALCMLNNMDTGEKVDYFNSGEFTGFDGYVRVIADDEKDTPMPTTEATMVSQPADDPLPTTESTVPTEDQTEPVSNEPFRLIIGNASVTTSQLKQANYKVPILITAQNPGIDTLEFGISSELPYEVINDPDSFSALFDLETAAGSGLNEIDSNEEILNFMYQMYNDRNYSTWFAFASSGIKKNYVLSALLVDVPEDARPGDVYTVDFVEEGEFGNPMICMSYPGGGNKVDYVAAGLFKASNGSITILEGDDEEPTTDAPEPTEEWIESLGDVNDDGMVNAIDATSVLIYSADTAVLPEKDIFTEEMKERGDVNRDGLIDALDANAMLNYAASLGMSFDFFPLTTAPKPEAGGRFQLGQQDVYITESDLKNGNYNAFFNLSISGMDKAMTALEFGLSSDLAFEITDSRYDDDVFPQYVNSSHLISAISRFAETNGKNTCWITWADNRGKAMTNLLFQATLPQTCKAGDTFIIDFLNQSPVQGKTAFVGFTEDESSTYKARLTGEGIHIHVISDADGDSHSESSESSYSETDETPALLAGDLDGTGEVNVLDVIITNKFLLGAKVLDAAQQKAADVNHDGKVDGNDSLLILKFTLDMITSFDA